MRKIIFFITSFLFLFSSIASSCDYIISKFGDSKEDLTKGLGFEIHTGFFPDQFGGETAAIPVMLLCGNDSPLLGTMAMYLYVDDKLVEVRLERNNMNDMKIMDYAMKKFGKFNLPSGPKKNFRGNHIWNKINKDIEYISTDIHEGHVEILSITSKLHSYELNKYYEKVGKWLDKQEY